MWWPHPKLVSSISASSWWTDPRWVVRATTVALLTDWDFKISQSVLCYATVSHLGIMTFLLTKCTLLLQTSAENTQEQVLMCDVSLCGYLILYKNNNNKYYTALRLSAETSAFLHAWWSYRIEKVRQYSSAG